MKYFFLLLWLRLKAGVRSAYFFGSILLLCAFSFAFCLLLPERAAVNVFVGLLTDESAVGRAAAGTLLANEDYEFVAYTSQEALTRDAAAGRIHCAYTINAAARPVTLYAAESAYMAPVLNEIVLAAYLEAALPEMAAGAMAVTGVEAPPNMEAYLAQVRAGAVPMTVELTSPDGSDWPERYEKSGLYPLLYALLAAIFVVCAVLRGLLHGEHATPRLPQGHVAASLLAPALADTMLGLVALLAADCVVAVCYPSLVYVLPARIAAFALLAAIAAVLCAAGRACPRFAARAVLLALPLVAVAWVLLSGAVVSPQLLPHGLGALRFLSPPWYALRVLAVLSM